MAGQTVNINLQVDSNLSNQTSEAKKLNRELEKSKQLASNMAGTAGSRKAASSALSSTKSKMVDDELNSYGVARGAVGTGAAGRDFAKTAQGLGGLVHVYATFAANIFAVSSAFNALKKAADTTNMIEGLNQLGAASGKNLGTMAKRMVELTDGAISLREAMAATAQGSSAGLSGEQMEKMAEVAKKASQALGRDMADAMTRLSRGITKIEPELLDELGIMVRVDKAAANYARTLGKTAASLTDFERRQAFAIAVLEQGEKKFGSIDIPSNPYSKLEASFYNLAQRGGELLNKVLGPIARLLAESPTALAAVMTGIAGTLLGRAIPAITQWREGLLQSAQAAAAAAKETRLAHEAYMATKAEWAGRKELAPMQEAANQTIANIQTSLAKALPESSKLVKRAFSDNFVPDKSDIKKYATALTRAEKSLASSEALRSTVNDVDMQKAIDQRIIKEKENVAQLKLANLELANYLKQQEAIRVKQEQINQGIEKPGSWWTIEGSLARRQQSAERTAIKSGIYAQASQDVQFMGVGGAFENLRKNVKENQDKLGKFNSTLVTVSGGFRILASGAMTFISSLGQIGMIIGLVTGAFAILNSWLSKTEKAQEEFQRAVELSKDSLDGISRTLNTIAKDDTFTTQNVMAYASSLNELSDSTDRLITKFKELKESTFGWDAITNEFKKLWGGDINSKFAESFSKNIVSNLQALKSGSTKSELIDELNNLLGTRGLSQESIEKGLSEYLASGKSVSDLQSYLKKLKEVNRELGNTSSRLAEYDESMKVTEKTMQDLINSFTPNDTMAKFGMAQMNQAQKLAEALQDPINSLKVLSEAANDFSQLKLLPPEVALDLAKNADALSSLNSQIKAVDDQVRLTENRIKTMEADGKAFQNVAEKGKSGAGFVITGRVETAAYKEQQVILNIQKQARNDAAKDVERITATMNGYATKLYEAGATRLAESFKLAAQQASIVLDKARIAGMSGAGTAKAQADIQLREIAIQERLLDSQAALILSQENLKLAIEESTIVEKDLQGKATEKDLSRLGDIRELQQIYSLPIKQMGSAIDKLQNGQVKLSTLPTRMALEGIIAQKQGLSSQKAATKMQERLGIIGEEADKSRTRIDEELKLLNITKSRTDELQKSLPVYSKELETLRLQNLEAIQSLDRAKEEVDLKEQAQRLEITTKGLKEGQTLLQAILENGDEKALQIANKILVSEQERANAKRKLITEGMQKEIEGQQFLLELENRRNSAQQNYIRQAIDSASTLINTLARSGHITEAQSISMQTQLDIRKQQIDNEQNIRELNESHTKQLKEQDKAINSISREYDDLIKTADTDPAALKNAEATLIALNAQKKIRDEIVQTQIAEKTTTEEINRLKLETIRWQQAYALEIAKTEELLRSSEKTGQTLTSEYFAAVADDFANKINTIARTAKSAASVLNEGIISALDSSIDKFFDMMQKSEFNLRNLIQFTRNALSDAFKEAAAQTAKNAWKDLLGSALPKTAAEKAQDNLITALNNLREAIEKRTPGTGMGEDPNNYGYDYDKDQKESVDKFGQKTDTFGGTIKQFGTDVQALVKGQMGVTDVFKNLIGNLGNTFTSFLISLGSTMSSSFAAGAAGGGGLLGGIGGFFGNLFGGSSASAGATSYLDDAFAMFMYKKGGVVDGSRALSSYSNSIVSSPTMFAFAKGAGLMGEAGPEAIMPLKRDAQGNLGVRATTGEVTNNVSITVNVSEGQASGEAKTSSGNSAELGNAIKAVVVQELIKQSRPGGLLAK